MMGWYNTVSAKADNTATKNDMVICRLTKIQNSNRPPSIYLEQWTTISPKNQAKAIADWKIEGPQREKARAARGLPVHIPGEAHDIYNKVTSEARARLDTSGGPAHAMSAVGHRFVCATTQ